MPIEPLEPRRLLSAVPRPDHVVVLIEENHSAAQVLGNADAPYLNGLASGGATFTDSHGVTHPSEPNYLALFSGSTQGITDDGTYSLPGANLDSELRAAGLSFAGYAENPSVRKHDPWESFGNSAAADGHAFAAFPADFSRLPTVSFVVPNLADDAHDGTLAAADAWAQRNIDAYAQWARANNSLLIVTFDEDDGSTDNVIPTIFYGANVQPGTYGETINHYNVLRTIEDAYGLPALGESASAPAVTDVWTTSAPTPTPTPTPTPVTQPPPGLTVAASAIQAQEGKPFGGVVATFSGSASASRRAAAAYSATITWGDGSQSAGKVRAAGGTTFTVFGTHRFTTAGLYPLSVSVRGRADGTTGTAGNAAAVADAPLAAAPATVRAALGQSFSGLVASFRDQDRGASASDFAGTPIDWGDGTPATPATVQQRGGKFTVAGAHTYTAAGTYTVRVAVQDQGGSGAEASSVARVIPVPGGSITHAVHPERGRSHLRRPELPWVPDRAIYSASFWRAGSAQLPLWSGRGASGTRSR